MRSILSYYLAYNSIIDKLKVFFERFTDIESSSFTEVKTTRPIGIQQNIYMTDEHPRQTLTVAEPTMEYGTKEEG